MDIILVATHTGKFKNKSRTQLGKISLFSTLLNFLILVLRLIISHKCAATLLQLFLYLFMEGGG